MPFDYNPLASSLTTDDLLAGGGESGALMRGLNWSRTGVGAVDKWPQSLRSSVTMILDTKFPMAVAWGQDHTFFYNDPFRPILGASKHPGAMGRPIREVFPEVWDFVGKMFETVVRGEAVGFDDLLLFLDRYGFLEECYFTFSYSPLRDESGQVGGVLITVTETTQRVLSERRLHVLRDLASAAATAQTAEAAGERAAQTLGDNVRDFPFALIYLVEGDGKRARLAGSAGLPDGSPASPREVDLAAAPDSGWPLGRVAHTHQAELVSDVIERFGLLPGGEWPESPHSALVLPIMRPGQVYPFGIFVAGLSSRRALDDGYRSYCELVADHMATAIANARAHEEERRRAEALAELDRAKTAFFSNVSHEFRTPLTLMLGPLEEALADQQLPPHQAERLDLIYRNGLRLLKLVNTLLDFSRIEAGRVQAAFEPVDLAALTAELASVFRSAVERAGLELVVDCPTLPEPVYVDREMWEKIVLNLISNAFKFTLEGGIHVTLRALPKHVELAVRDTGAGIAPEELPDIFVRFHRIRGAQARTHEGTGIGLALVQELVRLHGGTIHVTSEPGRGSTFSVRIPTGMAHLPPDRLQASRTTASTALGAAPYLQEALRWLPDAQTAPLQAEPDIGLGPSPYPARILLADDNADMRDYVKRLLSSGQAGWPGWTVEAVADGRAALAAIRQRPPDIVIGDVMMPGLDGFQLLRELRSDPETRNIPIILLSARAGEEARVEGLNAGADDYIVKPFSARELIARINAQLEVARREQAARRRMEAVLQQLPAGVIIAEAPSGRPLVVNDEVKRMVGYPFDEPIQVEDYDQLAAFRVLHLDGTPYSAEEMPLARAVRTGEVITGEEVQLALSDGRRLSLLAHAGPIRDDQGAIVAGVAAVIDITAMRQAEAVLRERDQHLRLALEAARMVAWSWDPHTNQVAATENLREIYGVSGVQNAEAGFALIHADDREAHRAIVDRALAEGSPYHSEFRIVRPDNGQVVWIEEHGLPLLDDTGKVQKMTGVVMDVTRRRQVEAERAALLAREQSARQQAERAAERIWRLQLVTAALAEAVTPAEVMGAILNQGISALQADGGAVMLVNESEQTLEVCQALGFPASTVLPRFPLAAPYPAAEAVRKMIPIWIESTEQFSRLYPEIAAMRMSTGHQAAAYVPLIIEGKALGGISISFGDQHVFDEEDRELILTLARQCAQAIDRTRLYEAERRMRVELEARVQERTAALQDANQALEQEIGERLRAQKQLEQWREQERGRIARELHDELGGELTWLKMEVARLLRRSGLPDELQKDLSSLSGDIDGTIESVRRIATELRPAVLDDFGLVAALEWQFNEFQGRTGVAGAFSTTVDEVPLSGEAANACFRIFQEALTNIARHADASQVRVELSSGDGAIRLLIADDGRGMPPNAEPAQGRLGMAGMRERARLLAGTLDIHSTPGQGTTVVLNVPVPPGTGG